jgi:hypothetical protein
MSHGRAGFAERASVAWSIALVQITTERLRIFALSRIQTAISTELAAFATLVFIVPRAPLDGAILE